MTPLHGKKIALVFGALILIGGIFLIFARMQSANRTPDVTNPVPSTGEKIPYAAFHELLNTVDGNKTIKNTACNFTFKLPENWSVTGILGESKILSPEDASKNEEWAKTHQELIQNGEGEAPQGPDARSLYISCGDTNANPGLKASSMKTVKIDGRDAYELAEAGKMPDGTAFTNYILVVEQEKIEIQLGQTEYDKLSGGAKQIIRSISFE